MVKKARFLHFTCVRVGVLGKAKGKLLVQHASGQLDHH
jgi:hypothetical protein